MLRAEQKPDSVKFSLAGRHPEPFDDGIEGTCRRELIEEINTTAALKSRCNITRSLLKF